MSKAAPLLLSLVSLVSVSVLAGCPKKKDDGAGGGATADSASATASAPAASASAPAPALKPTCTVANQKSWGKGVNTLTGLTAEELPDGTDVVGLALGNTPYVLVVKEGAAGGLKKVTVNPGSKFGRAPKAGEATRVVWRVTPVKIEGATVRAFVDFRDEGKGPDPAGPKWRRVVCGPADVTERWVDWEGPAVLEDPKTAKDPVAAFVAAHQVTPATPYREVRDCRTFFDPKRGEEWVVVASFKVRMEGATPKPQAELTIATPTSETLVHATEMHATPFKRVDYDTPISDELADGSFFVAARAGGALIASFMTHDKKAKGAPKSYPGYFQMPDLARDGAASVLVAAQATGKGAMTLRAMRISGEKLPAGFTNVTDEDDAAHTASRPEFLRDAKGQRWIAYLDDVEKGKGTLEVMPIGADFRSQGRPYAISKEDEKASEARLFAKPGGGFTVVYIRDAGASGGELVSEDLDCKVEK